MQQWENLIYVVKLKYPYKRVFNLLYYYFNKTCINTKHGKIFL